jgi:hypothetical protein
MNSALVLGCVLCVTLAVTPAARSQVFADGSEQLDQSHQPHGGYFRPIIHGGTPFAQTFTAGLSGRLSRVKYFTEPCQPSETKTCTLRFLFREVTPDGFPGEVLAEVTTNLPQGGEPRFGEVLLPSEPEIWAGRRYALQFEATFLVLPVASDFAGKALMLIQGAHGCYPFDYSWHYPKLETGCLPESASIFFQTWVKPTWVAHPRHYVGCFRDQTPRQLPDFHGAGYTVASCKQLARNRGKRFAGLQFGGECWVGDDPGISTTPGECDMLCPGPQDGTLCGGYWRNSVYDTWEYKGCFQSSIPSAMTYHSDVYWLCRSIATSRGSLYAGISGDSKCFIGSRLGDDPGYERVADAECSGGNMRLSVYGTGSGYVGCFLESYPRELPVLLGATNQTVESCIGAARATGYAYAGLQYHGECWAGNALAARPLSDQACDTPCLADQGQVCGGFNRISVYSTELASTPIRVYLQNSNRSSDTSDWDPGSWKGTCSDKEAVTGLSVAPSWLHTTDALCTYFPAATPFQAAVLTAPGERRRGQRWGDWDPGFYKLECGDGEYVSGVSQTPPGAIASFHGIRCSLSGRVHRERCEVRFVGGVDDRGLTGTGDWSSGNFKGECSPGKIVVGVSVAGVSIAGLSDFPENGLHKAHAILCCND